MQIISAYEPVSSRLDLSSVSQVCQKDPFWNNRQQIGVRLRIDIMMDSFQGLYYCTVHYQRRGKTLRFTRSINVTAVCETNILPPLRNMLNVEENPLRG